MEKRTSEVFKKWMTCSVSVYEKGLAQGTAEDRVTAVNNELCRTSLTKGVTVFDNQGMVVHDLKLLLAHVKAIKAFLDKGKWLDKRNKYGIGSFVPFVEWLLKNSKLKTYDLLVAYFDNPDLDQAIPYGNLFKKWLFKKYGRLTPNAHSILSRVKRVLSVAPHTKGNPTQTELQSMIDHMGNYVANAKAARDCQTAVRHYKTALMGK